jgi:hypothetical protein
LLSIPIASYYSIERLALIYFSRTQQDHKLNGIGITRAARKKLSTNS